MARIGKYIDRKSTSGCLKLRGQVGGVGECTSNGHKVLGEGN